ncbi:MAG TPA: glycosyltransferase family 39 protein [Ktedonobacteraceae bacterium]|nr:glycosyltransferase family 39 protein [Ktedonobacteraceae bacterium]
MSQVNVDRASQPPGEAANNHQQRSTFVWPGFLKKLHPYRTVVLGVLCFVLALGLNLYRLGAPSIWFDEAFSVELARQPLAALWPLIFGREPNMELYYLFLHFWLQLTASLGLYPTEFVVRFPSAVFAAASSVVIFVLGRRFLGTKGGVLAAALYLLNDLQLIYAQQTRSYSLQLLLTCCAWLALLMALNEPAQRSRLWWIGYVVANVLAIYAHLYSLLIVLGQCVAFGGLLLLPTQWREQARQRFWWFVVSMCITGVLIIPMLLVSVQGAKTGWLPVPHVADIVYFFLVFSGYSKPYLLAVAGCGLLGVVVVALSCYVWRSRRDTRDETRAIIDERRWQPLQDARAFLPLAWMLVCWFVVPFVVSYVISQGATRLFSSRYLVALVPPIMLLAGLCLVVLRWRVVQVVLALVLLALAVKAVPFYYKTAQVENWNTAVHWLEQRYQTGDGLVCYDNTINGSVKQGCQIAVEYYLQAYPGAAHFTADSPGAFSWQTYSAPDPEAAIRPQDLVRYGATHKRIFLIIGRVHDDAAAQRVRTTLQWLQSHEHLVDQVSTRTVNVYVFNMG